MPVVRPAPRTWRTVTRRGAPAPRPVQRVLLGFVMTRDAAGLLVETDHAQR